MPGFFLTHWGNLFRWWRCPSLRENNPFQKPPRKPIMDLSFHFLGTLFFSPLPTKVAVFRSTACMVSSPKVAWQKLLWGELIAATLSFFLVTLVWKLEGLCFWCHPATLEEGPAGVQSCGTRRFWDYSLQTSHYMRDQMLLLLKTLLGILFIAADQILLIQVGTVINLIRRTVEASQVTC